MSPDRIVTILIGIYIAVAVAMAVWFSAVSIHLVIR